MYVSCGCSGFECPSPVRAAISSQNDFFKSVVWARYRRSRQPTPQYSKQAPRSSCADARSFTFTHPVPEPPAVLTCSAEPPLPRRSYGSHCNSPYKHEMGKAMVAQGLCMYQMDLEGHGYSGGERAYVEDYHHWVDDIRQVRQQECCLYGGKGERYRGEDQTTCSRHERM